jgi:hypothetical protein
MQKLWQGMFSTLVCASLFQCALTPPVSGEPLASAAIMRAPQKVATASSRVRDWFKGYDSIRRNAEMTSAEKGKSQQFLSDALNPNVSAAEKQSARALLRKQISRYAAALRGMRALPKLSETSSLSSGYYNYFRTASLLFSDLSKVLDNPMASDGGGKPVLMKLAGRKSALESLDKSNKSLDRKLRKKYGIASYRGR